MAIPKQLVVSDIEASVFIKVQVPRMCCFIFLKLNSLQKANKSNLTSEVSIHQLNLE